MDLTSIIGIIAGISFILVGQIMEGGNIGQLLQITAAFIVFGGTFGAVVLSFSAEEFKNCISALKLVFGGTGINLDTLIQDILKYAIKARKDGIIALEKEAKTVTEPLLRLGLEAVADGADPQLARGMMENQITQLEAKIEGASKVWESAGGFSPTIGIIGAVLGLIQVMQNLSDPSKLGAGIAVAFVATVYGVGFANLISIPISTKIKFKAKKVLLSKELILEGIMAIQAGESPSLIERKLKTFILDSHMEEEKK